MSHPIVEQILAGTAAPMVRQAAAKGALPIPREDQLELWGCIRKGYGRMGQVKIVVDGVECDAQAPVIVSAI